MPLTLNLELLTDCYEASLGGADPEWPPHPARMFCALVSVAAEGSPDDEALRWLESQEPPHLTAPARVAHSERTAFVPTNLLTRKGGHQVLIGRTSGARSWARTAPAARVIRLVWPSADPSPAVLATLDQLGRRVGYLGRSTSPVLISFNRTIATGEGVEHVPRSGGGIRLRVPYRGYLDQLRRAHLGGEAAWSVSRSVSYALAAPDDAAHASAPVVAPVYPHLLVFAFEPGAGIDGRHAPAVARAFKAAVLQRLGRPKPDVDDWEPFDDEALSLLHGHHDGTRRQCAFLALPFVEHRHATGEVLGVAIALSPDLDPALRRALLLLAGFDRDDREPRLGHLRVPGLGRRCRLVAPDGRSTVATSRWCRPSQTWTTVLPVVLDWFPKRRYPPAAVLAEGCEVAGYPHPDSVEILPAPPLAGSPNVPRSAVTRRPGEPMPPSVHARLTFTEKLPGPVLVGHLRHLGLGLFAPTGASDG